jgi:cell division septation protein DedD
VEPGIRVAQLPPGPVVRMEPIPDGTTTAPPVSFAAVTPPPARTQIASAGSVVAMPPVDSAGDFQRRMDPIVSPGDFQQRMEPIVSPGDPGTIRTETLPPPPATRAAPTALAAAPTPSRGFALIPPAQAGTLPVAPRTAPAAAVTTGGPWGVQVGAFASENLARAAAGQARTQMGAPGARMVVEPVTQGRTTLFRARVIGLSSRSAAEQACDRLRGRGACMIVAPGV